MNHQKVVFIVGPTAVGKSKIAFELAKKINGEIVSCDSMQVYKEVAIANNKPTEEEKERIVHHLIDVVSVEKDFDVVKFNRVALDAIDLILKEGKCPIVVGGSGMYVKVLLDGIFEGADKDPELRAQLLQEAEDKGNDFIYQKLLKLDDKAAEKIHPNDTKRIIRALEVCLKEKKPISELQQQRQGIWGKFDILVFGINRDRKELYTIIEDRVEQMFESGIVKEVESLNKKKLSATAKSIIGIREIEGYLNGDYDQDRAKYLMKLHTRHLAKRQLTWFRKENRIQWFEILQQKGCSQIVDQMQDLIERK